MGCYDTDGADAALDGEPLCRHCVQVGNLSSPTWRRMGYKVQRELFVFTPNGGNSISSGPPHVRPIGRTCGEPIKIRKKTYPENTNPKNTTVDVGQLGPLGPLLPLHGHVRVLVKERRCISREGAGVFFRVGTWYSAWLHSAHSATWGCGSSLRTLGRAERNRPDPTHA